MGIEIPSALPAQQGLSAQAGHSARTGLPARPGLPPIGVYLRAVIALGIGSIRRAAPAIALLYFYRLGMGLYMAFSSEEGSPFGLADPRAQAASYLMQAAAYLPLLVLIYTPFLPLQDSILRGQRRGFGESVQHVLARVWPFAVSAIAQVVIVAAPPALLFGGMAVMVQAMPPRPEGLNQLLAIATLIPCALWVGVSVLFLLFATPAVVLDDRGPFRSLGESAGRVGRDLGGILGRLIVTGFLILLFAFAVSLPEAFLQTVANAAGYDHPAYRIARAVWASAVSAILFPFTVAALMVLYRSLVPATGAGAPGEGGPAGVHGAAAPGEPRPATTPYRFE